MLDEERYLSLGLHHLLTVVLTHPLNRVLLAESFGRNRGEDHAGAPVPTDTPDMHLLAVLQLSAEPRDHRLEARDVCWRAHVVNRILHFADMSVLIPRIGDPAARRALLKAHVDVGVF